MLTNFCFHCGYLVLIFFTRTHITTDYIGCMHFLSHTEMSCNFLVMIILHHNYFFFFFGHAFCAIVRLLAGKSFAVQSIELDSIDPPNLLAGKNFSVRLLA